MILTGGGIEPYGILSPETFELKSVSWRSVRDIWERSL